MWRWDGRLGPSTGLPQYPICQRWRPTLFRSQKNLEGSGKALLAFGDHVFLFRILTQTWRRHEVEHKSQHRPASGLEAVVRYYLLTCLLADTASQLVS